jgi:parvulin-like peptidyl-prolyl isomerase
MRHAVVVPLVAGLVCCAGGGKDTPDAAQPDDTAAVATLDDEPVPYGTFKKYLDDNAGDASEDGEQNDVIKSRLLDLFLEDQLLLRTSVEMGIVVSEAEVDAYLKELGVVDSEGAAGGADARGVFREQVRRGLILQKVKDAAVVSKIQVAPGEIEEYLGKHPDLLRETRRVVLRQILADDKSAADRIRAELSATPSRFEELAREYSAAPDRGQARTYQEEELPVALREPLLALEPGQISPVIEHAGAHLIFQMVRKVEAEPVDRAEIRRRVEIELFQNKIDQVLEQYIADLKSKASIHVNRAILPFHYVGEHRN